VVPAATPPQALRAPRPLRRIPAATPRRRDAHRAREWHARAPSFQGKLYWEAAWRWPSQVPTQALPIITGGVPGV